MTNLPIFSEGTLRPSKKFFINYSKTSLLRQYQDSKEPFGSEDSNSNGAQKLHRRLNCLTVLQLEVLVAKGREELLMPQKYYSQLVAWFVKVLNENKI